MEISGNSIGIIAGLLSFSAYSLYVVSMLRGQCRPNRMTWWTLTAIGVGVAISYYASGARQTIWIAIAYVAGPLIISLLSFRYGEGGWGILERFCILGVAVSLLLWWIFKSPLMALVVSLLVDFFVLVPTMVKSILRPKGEYKIAWAIETASNIINLFALEQWTFSLAIYPLYLIVVNMFITTSLFWPRKRAIIESIEKPLKMSFRALARNLQTLLGQDSSLRSE